MIPKVTAAEALAWIQEAMAQGRYVVEPHLYRRMEERSITLRDVKRVISKATPCVTYSPEDGSKAGGTSWRVTGSDLSGSPTSVGVEAFTDHLGRRALLITVF